MDFETAKTFAAFGGVLIGSISLFLMIYKDFFRKGKLKVEIENAQLIARSEGTYDFLLSINVSALGGGIYIKGACMQHYSKVFGPYNLESSLNFNKVVRYLPSDFLSLEDGEFVSQVKCLFKDAELLRDMFIEQNQRKSMTITDRFQTERLSDG